jgi:hypothetical protein
MPCERPASIARPNLAADIVRLLAAIDNRYDALQLDPEFGPLIRAAGERYEELRDQRLDFTACAWAAKAEAIQALCRGRGLELPAWPKA